MTKAARPARVEPVIEHVTSETYTTRRGEADVVLYKVSGGAPTWPGADDGSATQEVSATELVWDFFSRCRR
ncbi:hypothetical protein [Promicromonospora soli]|uniref:Uncharacterized protein n=1 Tax=Promicromonospora soli TaxID=2035533 RepID=A0A919FVA9_9MICO|nr:hypothetical protein [Promicromonospora soli]GHH72708.1 hypothetical protein GCM10017772_22710 [Promicromonospora soli]